MKDFTDTGLARDGGSPVRTAPLPTVNNASGRTFGEDELELLREVIESGQLNHTVTSHGKVQQFAEGFAEWLGMPHAVACSSGTAALHLAVAAIDPNPGDEIIVTPISDFGSVIPILAQNAVPVFADVLPDTWCIDPEQIRAQITDRTRAIMIVHLFGQPCDMDAIMAIADDHGIPVIEDCCQAYGTTWRGQRAGTFGTIGCFSLQQSKHISTGDGGIAVTNDPLFARRMTLFADKAWPRDTNSREHQFLGLNYRMTELQGAVSLAQLPKLDGVIAARQRWGNALTERIADWPGVSMPELPPSSASTFWLFPINVDPEVAGNVSELAAALNAEGIGGSAGYVTPMYLNPVLTEGRTYGTSHFPFDSPYTSRRFQDYTLNLCPVAESMKQRAITLAINERYTQRDVDDIAQAVNKVFAAFAKRS